jgi:hypothetical protein
VVRFLAVVVVALVCAGAATAARPDAHDRALVHRLQAETNAFAVLASHGSSEDPALQKCSFMKTKDAAKAFAAAFAVLPALLVQIVSQYKPQFTHLRQVLGGMQPDSQVFAKWLVAERQNLGLLLQFDNGGKPIDLCKAGEVMLSKSSTAADVRAVLGIDPALIAKLFTSGQSGSQSTITLLNPQMRTFFVQAGLTPKAAKALTS